MFVAYPCVFCLEDNGSYSVFFADFEGGTCGDNIEDAYRMAVDWLGINLMDYYLQNKPLPKAKGINDFDIKDCLNFFDTEEEKEETAKRCFKTLVGFDLIQYIKDTQKTTVTKIVSIPSWMNEAGKNYKLDFSNLLQEAIKKELDID